MDVSGNTIEKDTLLAEDNVDKLDDAKDFLPAAPASNKPAENILNESEKKTQPVTIARLDASPSTGQAMASGSATK